MGAHIGDISECCSLCAGHLSEMSKELSSVFQDEADKLRKVSADAQRLAEEIDVVCYNRPGTACHFFTSRRVSFGQTNVNM